MEEDIWEVSKDRLWQLERKHWKQNKEIDFHGDLNVGCKWRIAYRSTYMPGKR